MAVEFSADQRAVIDHRSGNLLVSAAAGSGKTTVMVQRILEMIQDPELDVSLDELLGRSDIVVLHCPLTDETRGMIDASKLALMKSSAVLINVARGPVVNSQDLADALNNGTIAAAGIDVFDGEPPLAVDNVLLKAKNALVTPHVAFATKESMTLRAEIVFDNLAAWMDGKQKNICL